MVPSTRRHPNASPEGEELISPVFCSPYNCVLSLNLPPRHWLLPHTGLVLPGHSCRWSSHIALLTHNTSSEPRAQGGGGTNLLSQAGSLTQDSSSFRGIMEVMPKLTSPKHPPSHGNGGSEDPATEQEVKSQEAGQAIWFCRGGAQSGDKQGLGI